ncbi:tetratricopeptide repeat protein [Haloferula sp. A504]|uniref:tetratricopeptide repeat protein n=1 Tax=Haloferula sp. A504 TaxID=3373601 RepID=UPI003795DAC3
MRPLATIGGCLLLLAAEVAGHHGPEEVVAELTAQLEMDPENVELLSRRATEYRALGMHAQAEADLRLVLGKHPQSIADTESLARVLWARGKCPEAMDMIQRAVELAQPGRERAAGWILKSEWELEQGRTDAALAACRNAFQEDPEGMVDWYLLRSRIEERLGRPADRLAGLKAGHEALKSIVLRNAWVDAALDAGHLDEAAPVIETELAKSRLKSSWWIRRARLRLGAGDPDGGTQDLKAAVVELDRRIHLQRPDAKLLVDRAQARALLGDLDAARDDLALAREHGADPWEVGRLANRIREEAKPTP